MAKKKKVCSNLTLGLSNFFFVLTYCTSSQPLSRKLAEKVPAYTEDCFFSIKSIFVRYVAFNRVLYRQVRVQHKITSPAAL